MPSAKLSGLAIAEGIAGFVLFWSGLKNQPLGATLKDLLSGKVPQDVAETTPTVGVTSGSGSGSSGTLNPGGSAPIGTSTDSAIANDALGYVGKERYVWGGDPDTGGTDCSGFVNWVVGHDLSMRIPGYAAGTFTGASHGPVTAQWAIFGSAIKRSQVQAGDILVWGPQVHMGIATSNTEFVSDQDPALGVGTADIDSATSQLGVLFCRRLTSTAVVPTG